MTKRKLKPEATPLTISFLPSQTFFEAILPNGARFAVELRDIHGKLRDNLILFREACLEIETTPQPTPLPDLVAQHLAAGGIIQICGRTKSPDYSDLTIDDLDLSI